MKKHTTSSPENQPIPVRENKPNSIGDGLKESEKEGCPYPSKKDKQEKNQPEFIDANNNTSKNDD